MDPPDVYPRRCDVPWDEIDGRVVLSLPQTRSPVQRIVAKLFPLGDTKLVTMEGASARIWHLCDGLHTARQIWASLAEVPHAEARAPRFFADLEARGYVTLEAAPAPALDAHRGLTPERGYARVRCRRCKRTHPMQLARGAPWFCPHCKKLNRGA